jgi:hypothetical protein
MVTKLPLVGRMEVTAQIATVTREIKIGSSYWYAFLHRQV